MNWIALLTIVLWIALVVISSLEIKIVATSHITGLYVLIGTGVIILFLLGVYMYKLFMQGSNSHLYKIAGIIMALFFVQWIMSIGWYVKEDTTTTTTQQYKTFKNLHLFVIPLLFVGTVWGLWQITKQQQSGIINNSSGTNVALGTRSNRNHSLSCGCGK